LTKGLSVEETKGLRERSEDCAKHAHSWAIVKWRVFHYAYNYYTTRYYT